MSGQNSPPNEPGTLSPEQLKEYVQDVMDWTSYQAEAYVAVVRNEPVTPSDIVATTDVPQGRVYDVMSQLEGEAVNVQDHQPKRYQAQHPRSLLGDKQEEFNDKADAAMDHLEQQHEIQRERREPRHPAWVIPGISGTKRELMEGIMGADDRVLMMEHDGRWIQSNEIRDLGRLVNDGVTIEVIGWSGWGEKIELLVEEAGVTAWMADSVDSSFCVVDEDLAIMRVGREDTGVKIEDGGPVDIMRTAFEATKQDATVVPTDA